MIVRFRRATGDERLQLKWFAVGAAMVLVGILAAIQWNSPVAIALQDAAAIFWFATIAIAILKYRLYEIDVVINEAVVYGTLAVFITLVYVGLVVGVGTLVGNNRSPLLSAVAAAMVAVAFQPVRQWAGGWPTASCTGRARRRTRCCRTSRSGSPGRTRPRTCCRGWRRSSPRAPARSGRWYGCGSATELRAEASSGDAPATAAIRLRGGAMPAMPERRARRSGRAPGRAAGRDLGSDAARRAALGGRRAADRGRGLAGGPGALQRPPDRGAAGVAPAHRGGAGPGAPAARAQHPRRRAAAAGRAGGEAAPHGGDGRQGPG